MRAWGIDPAAAAALDYQGFKAAVKKNLPAAQQRALAREERGSTVLQHYRKHYVGGDLQFSKAQQYLCGGACGRGRELVLQLRAGSLPLACLTGKFGRRRRDNPEDPAAFRCPACANAEETPGHFLLDCPKYALERSGLLARLEDCVSAADWSSFLSLSLEDRACALLDFDRRFKCEVVASLVAPFVASCWKARAECVSASSAPGRVVYGSDAETE